MTRPLQGFLVDKVQSPSEEIQNVQRKCYGHFGRKSLATAAEMSNYGHLTAILIPYQSIL